MTGSIEKRGKDNYRLVVFKGYDLDGKSIRHQKKFIVKTNLKQELNLQNTLQKLKMVLLLKEMYQHLKNSLKYGNVIMD